MESGGEIGNNDPEPNKPEPLDEPVPERRDDSEPEPRNEPVPVSRDDPEHTDKPKPRDEPGSREESEPRAELELRDEPVRRYREVVKVVDGCLRVFKVEEQQGCVKVVPLNTGGSIKITEKQ